MGGAEGAGGETEGEGWAAEGEAGDRGWEWGWETGVWGLKAVVVAASVAEGSETSGASPRLAGRNCAPSLLLTDQTASCTARSTVTCYKWYAAENDDRAQS